MLAVFQPDFFRTVAYEGSQPMKLICRPVSLRSRRYEKKSSGEQLVQGPIWKMFVSGIPA
jgi:hypothetical protein